MLRCWYLQVPECCRCSPSLPVHLPAQARGPPTACPPVDSSGKCAFRVPLGNYGYTCICILNSKGWLRTSGDMSVREAGRGGCPDPPETHLHPAASVLCLFRLGPFNAVPNSCLDKGLTSHASITWGLRDSSRLSLVWDALSQTFQCHLHWGSFQVAPPKQPPPHHLCIWLNISFPVRIEPQRLQTQGPACSSQALCLLRAQGGDPL